MYIIFSVNLLNSRICIRKNGQTKVLFQEKANEIIIIIKRHECNKKLV